MKSGNLWHKLGLDRCSTGRRIHQLAIQWIVTTFAIQKTVGSHQGLPDILSKPVTSYPIQKTVSADLQEILLPDSPSKKLSEIDFLRNSLDEKL